MTARYLVFSGGEGTGKTTQCRLLAEHLRFRGYRVLESKEPGHSSQPLTMTLRDLMLNQEHDASLTPLARELISQTIRSIHYEKRIKPALETHDFIIQDRGVLDGLAYGWACGNDPQWLLDMAKRVCNVDTLYNVYSDVVVLRGSVSTGLDRALSSKKEFAAGDAIETKGPEFLCRVEECMRYSAVYFPVRYVDVDGRDIVQVHEDILRVLNLK